MHYRADQASGVVKLARYLLTRQVPRPNHSCRHGLYSDIGLARPLMNLKNKELGVSREEYGAY